MKEKFYITISREYGSGGIAIGRKLAQCLNVAFYDKTALDQATSDEQGSSDSSEFKSQTGQYESFIPSAESWVYQAHRDAIIKTADANSLIVTGRCSETILAGRPHLLRIFLHAPVEIRVKNLMDRDGYTDADAARKDIKKVDTCRRRYCHSHSGQKWGDYTNYDMIFNTEKVDIDYIVDFIIDYMKKCHSECF